MSNYEYVTVRESRDRFGFRKIELLKEQALGTGSYGGVCKAKCDGLICAAKIMHPTLFDRRDPGTVSYLQRFEQECHFLSSIRHPNIVQYLGTYCDPDTHLPVLLMELCDESLSRFLERSPMPLAYQLQLNMAHDIVLALKYLHLNFLTHRDLTGNNVLIIAGVRAKVTDFGMSRLSLVAPRKNPMTLCPGNIQYMSPEALDESPSYTNKLDIFSFGVLLVQIATRKFPEPGPRFQPISVPDYPEGSVRVAISEVQRRSSHLKLIPATHPLKSVAVGCLREKERERPSAEELSEIISELKQAPVYANIQCTLASEIERGDEEKEVGREDLQKMQSKEMEEELGRARAEISEKEREIFQLQAEPERMESVIKALQETLKGQELGLSQGNPPVAAMLIDGMELNQKREADTDNKGVSPYMVWKKQLNAPEQMFRGSAVVQGDTVFINPHNSRKVYVCKVTSTHWQCWSKLPDAMYFNSSLAFISNTLVSVGGQGMFECTNSVVSLPRRGLQGRRVFPDMPTPRCDTVSVTAGHFLIVAGGYDSRRYLDTVEVMDTYSEQWTISHNLPQPCGELSAAVCGGVLYLGGGYDESGDPTKSVVSCSLLEMLTTSRGDKEGSGTGKRERVIWRETPELPLTQSSLVVCGGSLLALGGQNSSETYSSAVHCLESQAHSWRVVSHLSSPRNQCFAVALPGDQVFVIGGWSSELVEIGTFHPAGPF